MLTHLDRIAPKFMLVALPLNLQGMDGAPARVIGIEG
jgi:kynurenine formamidase